MIGGSVKSDEEIDGDIKSLCDKNSGVANEDDIK